MDWITDCAYRIICKEVFARHGNPEDELMLWTEFMSADGYIHAPAGVVHHILTTDFEPELIVQIFWGNIDSLKQCALDLRQTYGFTSLEINMWCPSPTIMKCGAGSALLKDRKNALDLLAQLADTWMRLSLKTRVGLNVEDKEEQFDFVCAAAKHVWLIALHGRTYQQSHAGEVDRDFIYRLKQALPDKVIIGNGGLRSYEDAKKHCSSPLSRGDAEGRGVLLDGTMIAQSAIGNPRILTPHTPTLSEKKDVILRHLDLMMVCERYLAQYAQPEKMPLRQPTKQELEDLIPQLYAWKLFRERWATPREIRKYLFAYVTWIPNNKELKQQIAKIDDYMPLRECLEQFFEEHNQNVPPPVKGEWEGVYFS